VAELTVVGDEVNVAVTLVFGMIVGDGVSVRVPVIVGVNVLVGVGVSVRVPVKVAVGVKGVVAGVFDGRVVGDSVGVLDGMLVAV
jgi:hypothetical protein